MDNLYNILLQSLLIFPGPFWANYSRPSPRDFFNFGILHLGSDTCLRHPGVFLVFRQGLGYFVTASLQRRWIVAI